VLNVRLGSQMRVSHLALGLLVALPMGTFAAGIPAAVSADPPQDHVHPAGMLPFGLPTHGVKINAVLYTAAGQGSHPTVLLLHGIPGNEQNLDLARAAQRAGWNVLTLHYRGSWGSPGSYSFTHCLEDASAAVDWLRDPRSTAAANIDRARIVVVGHSLGGFIAAYLAGHDRQLAGAALISATRYLGAPLPGVTRAELVQVWEADIMNHAGMHTLGDATAVALAEESISHSADWDLKQFAPMLAQHPLLVVSSEDGGAASNERIANAVEGQPNAKVTRVHFMTDHSYNDQRIALTTAFLSWLSSIVDNDADGRSSL
jgi:uncharacterized protein